MSSEPEELLARAIRAYFISAQKAGNDSHDQPNRGQSGVYEYREKVYVVVEGGGGERLLAVYRLQDNGVLRRIKRRWPKEFYSLHDIGVETSEVQPLT